MQTHIIHGAQPNTLRLLSIGEHEVKDANLLFNGGPNDFRDKLFAIYIPFGNFAKCLGILWSEGEHEVLNDAADAGLLDGEQVEESEVSEEDEENGTYIRLGNASEPFDMQQASIVEIPREVWSTDFDFVYALGRASENPSGVATGADI